MTKDWISIIDEVHELQTRFLRRGSTAWYRGQSSAEWPLRSSLHRYILDLYDQLDIKSDDDERVKLLREEGKTNYRDFKSNAWSLLDERQRDPWGLLFAMQHNRIPTTLLDWTESFACALYFAQLNRREDADSAVFVIDPAEFNAASISVSGIIALHDDEGGPTLVDTKSWHPGVGRRDGEIERLSAVAVAPILNNPRMVAQRCTFVICGDDFEPLEDKHPDLIHKIVIPAAVAEDADMFLDLSGSSAYGYFPDLDGLSKRFEARREMTVREGRIIKESNQSN